MFLKQAEFLFKWPANLDLSSKQVANSGHRQGKKYLQKQIKRI